MPLCNCKIVILFIFYRFSKQEYDNQSMSNEYGYSRGRPPAESTMSRIAADWDINDSIIPRVNIISY